MILQGIRSLRQMKRLPPAPITETEHIGLARNAEIYSLMTQV